MKQIPSARLDSVASLLESKGLLKLATDLDMVSNALDKSALSPGNLKDKVLRIMPIQKALSILKGQKNLQKIFDEVSQEMQKPSGVKTAGILDLLKNPLKLAVLAVILYTGSTSAGVVEDLAERMPEPSGASMALLDAGVAPKFIFEGRMESMIENSLEENSELKRYINSSPELKGKSGREVKDILVKAFNHKLKEKPDLRTKLESYLKRKDVQDTTGYLSRLVGDAIMGKL